MPQRTGPDFSKPNVLSTEDPTSPALLPPPKGPQVPTHHQAAQPGPPGAWCPPSFLPWFHDAALSLHPFLPPNSFLSLAGNQIKQVENLRDLPHLQFLDLSENLIETLKLGRKALAPAHGISLVWDPLLRYHLLMLALAARPLGVWGGCTKRQRLWAGRGVGHPCSLLPGARR